MIFLFSEWAPVLPFLRSSASVVVITQNKVLFLVIAGSLDVSTSKRWKDGREDYKNLRKALCVGYANQLAERMLRHNGFRTIGYKSQLVQVERYFSS